MSGARVPSRAMPGSYDAYADWPGGPAAGRRAAGSDAGAAALTVSLITTRPADEHHRLVPDG
jgi:hypothetical protein